MGFKHYHQKDAMDCGPACLQMIVKHSGKFIKQEKLQKICSLSKNGVSLLGISEAAEKIGFRSIGVRLSWDQIANEAHLPCIVHWKQNHFVVVYKITGKGKKIKVWVADPAHGLIKYTREEFLRSWLSDKAEGEENGIALLLEPGPDFYNIEDEKPDKKRFRFLLQYLRPHRRFLVQIMLAMLDRKSVV